MLLSLGAVIVVGCLNVDSAIAKFNINKYKTDISEDKEIDIAYLKTLSYDAVPVLVEFYKQSDGEVRQELAYYLEKKYYDMLSAKRDKDFRSFNIRWSIAFEKLAENIVDIENDARDCRIEQEDNTK